jgi:multiple sugar transport system substrate-binding protein
VLNQLQTLYQLVDAECLQSYPTALLNRMAQTNQIWYIPITYGYVNYSMRGYAPNQLTFHSLPSTSPHGGTLGGVGLAISAYSQLRDQAVQYATWVAGAECQQTVYALSGGQPANRQAWTSATLNNLTNQFYQNTLTSTERAFVRPRFDGFHHFQSQAGRVLQAFLQNQHSVKNLIEDWKKLFQQAKT